MAIYRTGTFLVPAANAAYNLNLGFVPSVFRCYDVTVAAAGAPDATATMVRAYWDTALQALSTPVTLLETAAAGVLTVKNLTTDGIASFISPDSALYVPNQVPYNDGTRTPMGASTLLKITAISKAANAQVTSALHSLTAADEGVTKVTFHYCTGMSQINTLTGTVVSIVDVNNFTVNINSLNFSTFTNDGKGQCNVITGAPANTLYSNVSLPTAQANLGFIGLTIGTGIMGAGGVTAGDTFFYEAILQSPATGP